MHFLSFIKNHWGFLGTAVLCIVIGVQYMIINIKNTTILELNAEIDKMKTVIDANNVSINSFESMIVNYNEELESIQDQLAKCNVRMSEQIDDMFTIDRIMECDNAPVAVETTSGEVKPDVKPISNTTETKGIDFINQQFDAIK